MASPNCLRLFWHFVRFAASRTLCTAGSKRPIRMAMIAITTSSSISVNPPRRIFAFMVRSFRADPSWGLLRSQSTVNSNRVFGGRAEDPDLPRGHEHFVPLLQTQFRRAVLRQLDADLHADVRHLDLHAGDGTRRVHVRHAGRQPARAVRVKL